MHNFGDCMVWKTSCQKCQWNNGNRWIRWCCNHPFDCLRAKYGTKISFAPVKKFFLGTKKFYVRIPLEWTSKNLMNRIFSCELPLNRKKIDQFLEGLMSDVEKRNTFRSFKTQRSCSKGNEPALTVFKPELTTIEEHEGGNHLWPAGEELCFFRTRPYYICTSILTRKKVRKLGRKVLMHSPVFGDWIELKKSLVNPIVLIVYQLGKGGRHIWH